MPLTGEQDFVILSDLHLSAGYDPRTGTYSRNEDFFYDAAFARFLDNLRVRAGQEGRRWRLVILGDMFDFLQIEGVATGTSSAATVAKLDRIAQGHPEFFQALGTWVDSGFPLDVVPGNHDIELLREPEQARFREHVTRYCSRPETAAEIRFYPWIYFVPGVLYAEHGHQYEGANSFTTPLRPYAPEGSDAIDLPLGSYFVLYFFNRIEAIDPFADNIKPSTRYLYWAFRTHPFTALTTLGHYARFLTAVFSNTSPLSRQERAMRRERYQREDLSEYAADLGLRAETVARIDQLSATPVMSSRTRLLYALLVRPLLPSLPALGGVLAIYTWLRRVRFTGRPLVMFAAGLAGLAWRERRLLRPETQRSGYLNRAALAIHVLLREENKAVPNYVFGHTHTAEQYPLSRIGTTPRYLNAGTWTPIVPGTFELLGSRERFTFIQITHEPETGAPIARLLFWNDAAGRQEPLPLLTI